MRTRVKICGITRIEDALAAVDAGADALGFVFYSKSPRAVSIADAASIISRLPAFVTSVALFVDAEPEYIQQVVDETQVDLLQFHGRETADECGRYSRPYIKALRMKPDLDLNQEMLAYASARGVLLDAYTPGIPGGTGEQFDWSRIPADLASGITLAGGLDSSNVAAAIDQVRPYAIDVSGGVEQSKGIKDAQKLEQFIAEVHRVNNS